MKGIGQKEFDIMCMTLDRVKANFQDANEANDHNA